MLVVYFEHDGNEYVRKCDMFRGWSEQDGSAAFHNAMLREIVTEMRCDSGHRLRIGGEVDAGAMTGKLCLCWRSYESKTMAADTNSR